MDVLPADSCVCRYRQLGLLNSYRGIDSVGGIGKVKDSLIIVLADFRPDKPMCSINGLGGGVPGSGPVVNYATSPESNKLNPPTVVYEESQRARESSHDRKVEQVRAEDYAEDGGVETFLSLTALESTCKTSDRSQPMTFKAPP